MSTCTCKPDLSGAPWCSLHRCDCNIWCCHRGMAQPHIFAPGEWCGGEDKTWRERRPGGKCRVHPPTQQTTEAAPNRAASFMPGDIVTVNNPGSVWHGRVGRVRYNVIDAEPIARIDFPDLYSKLMRHEHLTEGEQK